MMREIDMTTPFTLPEDRPLTYAEQVQIWKDICPPQLQGGWPEGDPSENSKRGEKAADEWDMVRRAELSLRDHKGWLLNRLDWDREWVGPVEGVYEVPDFCKPGAKRMGRSRIASIRRDTQQLPDFKGAQGWEEMVDDIGSVPF